MSKIVQFDILMQMPMAICIFKGKKHRLAFANDFYLQILNKEREVVGKDFFDIFLASEDQDVKEILDNVMATGNPFQVNEHKVRFIKNNDGIESTFFFNCVYQPFRNKKNEIDGVMVIFAEVTAQILAKNEKIKNNLKLTADLVLAQKKMAFQDDEKGKRAAELGIADTELIFQNREKEETKITNARDISEQKNIAEELNKARNIAELAAKTAEEAQFRAEQAMHVAKNATIIAENAVKAKQQFLSNMSHEIRTPMNAIIGFTKVLLKTDFSVKQKEYLTAIKVSGDALIVLINDILDLAKVDAGKMDFEKTPFKMSLSIAAMLHLFEAKIQEKNLLFIKKYDETIPTLLLGDSVRLHQIILNLVSNAVKFTAEGAISVSVLLLREDPDSVSIEFSVTDTGIGIKPEKLEKIFENFQQASSGTSRIYGGTGLGLAIVKQLIEGQNGTIQVRSTENHGSTFSFVLDFEKTNQNAPLEADEIAFDTSKKNIKVLVVEDMALNQLLMKTLLDDFGFEQEIASNGKIAIEKLSKRDPFGIDRPFDVVLMDLQMPEMNGFEATEYIRTVMKSDIPIIALTADVTTVDVEKCKAIGMNDYIAKPVDERLLYTKIMHLVKQKSNIKLLEDARKIEKLRCTDLGYLIKRTKSNPTLMMDMIALYLEQTPPLIAAMKESFLKKDWKTLDAATHKMIPSFAIMGMSPDFEGMARKVQHYASTQGEMDEIHDLIAKLDHILTQSCEELEQEFNTLKMPSHE